MPDAGALRLLRRLVTGLTAVMIVGVVILVGLLVTRLTDTAPILPETLSLPEGAQAEAVTVGKTWVAVVTKDQRILVFDRLTGALRQTVELTR